MTHDHDSVHSESGVPLSSDLPAEVLARLSFDVDRLASYAEGDVVEYASGKYGVVSGVMKESFKWADGKEVEASSENPIIIVALETGGSKPFAPSDLKKASIKDLQKGEGANVNGAKDIKEAVDGFETAAIYDVLDDPDDLDEFQATSAMLANLPGVDDPEVGFATLPKGWTRKSVLQAWASLGGSWRSCFSRMSTKKGPRFARRWCSALKDEVLGTEMWRGKF